jgi:predicted ATP-grasp superfamily ATP-dependent carboligase
MCPRDLFEDLYDKGRFAQTLEELGLPGPHTQIVSSVAAGLPRSLDFPLIVKPLQGEASEGIERVESEGELERSLSARPDLLRNPVLVQSFIPGHDIDLSLLADHGEIVAWTIQQTSGNGTMRFSRRNDVLELGKELVRRTNYHGVLHLDMRIDERDGRVFMLEANPRFWGSLCYSVWVGVNFLDLGLQMLERRSVERSFVPPVVDCPYLAVTRRSLPRALVGGWPIPMTLNAAQRRSWQFHHKLGRAALGGLLKRTHRPR